MSGDDRTAAVTALASEALRGEGLLVEDVSITPAGRRRVVRVAIDRDLREVDAGDETSPVPPLSLDEVADASRLVSDALDGSDVLGQSAYVLEVSSPGIGRPLREPRHFRRNVGRLVRLRLADGTEQRGRLVAASDRRLVLVSADGAEGADAPTREVALADIARATVQVDFSGAHTDDEEED